MARFRPVRLLMAALAAAALSAALPAGSAAAGTRGLPAAAHPAAAPAPIVAVGGYRHRHAPRWHGRHWRGKVYRHHPRHRPRAFHHRRGVRVIRRGPCIVRIVRPTRYGRVVRVIDTCRY